MNHRLLIGACAVAIAAFANPGHAQSVSTKLGMILPYTGMYYDRNQSGSGLSVDIGQAGMLFLQFATYDASGNQVNYIMQPTYVPSTEAALASTGIIGTATGQAVYVTNGQCPGCPYIGFPAVHPLSLNPVFTWTRPRHVDMSFAQGGTTYTYHFDAGNYEGKNDEEFLPGTWAVSWINDNSVYPGQGPQYQNTLPTEAAVMRIAPASFTMAQVALDPGSSADVKLPPPNAHLYTLACAGDQDGLDDAACNATELIWTNVIPGSQRQAIPRGTAKALIWFDSASATSGFDIYQQGASGNIVIGPADFHGQVYVTPNTLQTHLVQQGPPGVSAATDGIIGAAMTFSRLPVTAVRDCYDYPSTNPCQ